MKQQVLSGRELTIRVIREPAFVPMTPRKREVCWNFGIPPREAPFTIAEGLTVRLRPGSIVLLTGPSGSGKSSVLGAIAEQAGEVSRVGQGRFPEGKAIVDCVAPRRPLATALEILTACGLGEPRLWVRRFDDLSDGEKFRAWLARAIGQSVAEGGRRAIVCDEFTAILHRRAAKAIAYNLRKLVTRSGLTLVAATTHEDVIEDLQPDQLIRLGGEGPSAEERERREAAMSLRRRATIEAGSVRDYGLFGPMHYRHRDNLGFIDKVFLMRERAGGEPLGILVFAHAPMELALRNLATRGRFVRNVRRLNRELRILRRLVMHPDVRGCGLGHWFVERTLPQVGVRFVECLASMGVVNPVFEKAGMQRVGRCPLPRGRMAMLARMKAMRLDPFAADFSRRVGRCPRVRRLVEKTIRDWARTQGESQYQPVGRPAAEVARTFWQLIGEPPIYYLWDRRGEFPRESEDDEAAMKCNPSRLRGDADWPTRRTDRDGAKHSPDAAERGRTERIRPR